MSLIFLDPNIYCYSAEEWVGGDALDRLDRFVTILSELSDSEENIEAGESVSFLLPDELLLFSYEVNPNIDSPENGHYHRLFRTQIMPAFTRRRGNLDFDNGCDQVLSDHISIADSVATEALQSFVDGISLTEAKSIIYAYHPQRISLDLAGGCFSDEVSISEISGRYFVNHHHLFPLAEKMDVACAITEAINVLRDRLSIEDATWLDFNLTSVLVHDDFVPSVSGADFRGLIHTYQDRLIYTILQIVAARRVTTSEHRMTAQTVTYQNATHGKWNAYVFQMGPDATDTRCSRLYFAKVNGGMLLFRYDGDAHP